MRFTRCISHCYGDATYHHLAICLFNSAVLSVGSTSELTFRMRGYRFYAALSDTYHLYILYSDRVTNDTLESHTRELLNNIVRHHADLLQPS
jgi:hypothetical protein